MFAGDSDDLFLGTDRHAVVTLWFVTTANPAAVVATPRKADRGFGRKLLAQMNPAWPITPIGQFSLNRSAQASKGEFYIGSFPGLAVIQTVVEDASKLSELDARLRTALPAADVFVFARNEKTGMGGFAHFTGDTVKRCFSGRRERVYEDMGLPEPFEAPYWAGEKAQQRGGIALPFEPHDLVDEAQRAWLGFDVADGPDVNVAAFAVDGRPEPKIPDPKPKHRAASVDEIAAVSATKLGLGTKRDYDDYEDVDENLPDGGELERFVDSASATTRRVARTVGSVVRGFAARIGDRIRHSDRPRKKD